jgi:diaminopimelate epimerase
MRVFNSDGCEAKMCGNGIRCLGKFLKEFDESITKIAVEVSGTGYLLSIGPKSVQVHMGPPTALTLHLSLEIGTEKISYDFIDTGVPHAVIFTDSLEQINVNELGLKIRHHPNFDPDGTNVNFAKVLGDDRIAIRSFERGVEKETLACGTGAAAAAIAAWKRLALANPIKVITRSGEEIEFLSKNDGARIKNMIMYGPARLIFRGEIELPPFCCE